MPEEKIFGSRYTFLKRPSLSPKLKEISQLRIFFGEEAIQTEVPSNIDFRKEAEELHKLLGFFPPQTLIELKKLL